MLTYGNSNSLAASLEILSFLREEHKKGEVLHGEDSYIAKRIAYLGSFKKEEKPGRLGVFGKPSDWLISSDADYKKAREIFHINLIVYGRHEKELCTYYRSLGLRRVI